MGHDKMNYEKMLFCKLLGIEPKYDETPKLYSMNQQP